MRILYQLFILLYPLAARLIAPFNAKAKAWTNGRKRVFDELGTFFAGSYKPVIWMHCSSLGEFEQGLPLAEKLKSLYPGHQILISFFSPSGYMVRQHHPVADHVCYLPMDSYLNARKFLDIVQPQLAIFIKYEFWHYYLQALKDRNIPTLLVSAIFRQDQLFFRWYGGFYRKMLSAFSRLFVQDDQSALLMETIGLEAITDVSGDTRFDRVIEIASQADPYPAIELFCGNAPVIVAGSTWSEDDKTLHHLAVEQQDLRMIIAPHDIEKERLEECLAFYPEAVLYSDYFSAFQSGNPIAGKRTLIIDNMGMLSSIYRYASIAFIGGGFTEDGIHNTLEAAVYHIPVVFGPVYKKYLEATELIETGAAFSALNVIELEEIINNLLQQPEFRKTAGKMAGDYVREKAGATEKIVRYIQEKRLLIS